MTDLEITAIIDNKICPMPNVGECLREKCAWWMDDVKCCAITSLAWSQDVMAGYAKECG